MYHRSVTVGPAAAAGAGATGAGGQPVTMHFPIRRRDGVSHDQVVGHWRDVHMPAVVAHMTPRSYAVTIFDQQGGTASYDGMASITYDDLAVARREQVTDMPAGVAGDGFGRLIRRSSRLECTRHVIVDGPRPAGAHKVVGLVGIGDAVTTVEAWRCWLDEHAPHVARGFEANGGLRYVVSLADRNEDEAAFLGVAELWFESRAAARSHLAGVAPDRFGAITTATILHGTEVIGIA